MDKRNNIILVSGVTGQQGSAVARHLVAKGWSVRGLTRNPSKPAAQALMQAGVQIVQGDNDDRVSLDAAMKSVYGVFSVQNGELPGVGYEGELFQGRNIADAAKDAGVLQFIYASVAGAEAQSRFRKLAKWEIEQYIQGLALPATIFRPVGFMDDFVGPRFGALSGRLSTAINPDVLVPLIAVEDIGAFVALAFDRPEDYLGKTMEIAGDALTPPQIAAAISRATGRSILYTHIPMDVLRQKSAEAARVFEWYNDVGYQVNIPALRKLYPALMDFDTWLTKEGKAKFEALVNAKVENCPTTN